MASPKASPLPDPDLEKKLADAGITPGTLVVAADLGPKNEPLKFAEPAPFVAPDGVPQIYAALANAKRVIAAVAKDGKYSQGNTQYNFRGVDAVVNAVSPALAQWGIVLGFEVLRIERVKFQTRNGGDAVQVLARVRYDFITIDGSRHSVEVEAEANDTSDKATGKVMSVAYRIMLLQVFAIPTHDKDPDEDRIEAATRQGFTPNQATWLRRAVGNASLRGLDTLWALVRADNQGQESCTPGGNGPTWARLFNDRKAELEANQPDAHTQEAQAEEMKG